MKGRRGPRSLTGKGQGQETGTIEIFTSYMKSFKEWGRMKGDMDGSMNRKRLRDVGEDEGIENDDTIGKPDDSRGLGDEMTPPKMDIQNLENLGIVPESRNDAGMGAKSGIWKEPRKKKLKLFKQIKGQGQINWIIGRVPGDYEKEGGTRYLIH